jgi:(E)-4-hydroxy-3-methylbut-2-enyl-diphosphate synthase
VKATVAQIKRLEAAGCEIARVAVKDLADAAAVRAIKRKIKIPLVCDIHFNYRLALASIAAGADKIRLNPGNVTKAEEIAEVVKAAKKARIPIRVGVNSGSAGSSAPAALVKAATGYIKILEALNFHDIIISLKASDVVSTVEAYRKMSDLCDYPLHLGVTAAGPYDSAIVKSSIGIGSLLLDGIGDTIRVSLTADPVEEVVAAKRILSALHVRRFGPDIISCPTCGRCQVDLVGIVKKVEHAILNTQYSILKRPVTIAIMGCEVNGPGEAREADIGIAFGKGSGVLFKKGKIVKKVAAKNAVKELLKLL